MINKQEEILEYLDYIKSQNRAVSVMRSFMGVSFSREMNIASVSRSDHKVIISTQKNQKISLLPNTIVSIHSDLFPKPIQGKVVSIDNTLGSAMLEQLDFVQIAGDNRTHARIEAKAGAKSKIIFNKEKQILAGVANISLEGLSLVINTLPPDMEDFLAPQSSIVVQIWLPTSSPPSGINMTLKCKVTYTLDLGEDGKTKIGLQTYPNENERSILRRYIFDMQTEIFKEITSSGNIAI
jgi:hypothetical protein